MRTKSVFLIILSFLLSGYSIRLGAQNLKQHAVQEKLAYTIGVQAYLYGQQIMDLYGTLNERILDTNRGHDKTLNEFNKDYNYITQKIHIPVKVMQLIRNNFLNQKEI